jgi:hypothetical protein
MPMQRLESTDISQEHFYSILEQEMRKIELFTKKQVVFVEMFASNLFVESYLCWWCPYLLQVVQIRTALAQVESTVSAMGWRNTIAKNSKSEEEVVQELTEIVEKAGEDFLKYVEISLCTPSSCPYLH